MKILVVGDTHLPWTVWDLVQECAKEARRGKYDAIVQLGDFSDQHMWSRHAKYADSPSAELEWDQTEEAVKRFVSLFPKNIPMLILEGNHCRRIMMRATEAQVPRKLVRRMDEIFDLPDNVVWHLDSKPLILDGVRYIHGDELGGNAWQKAQRMGVSIMQGHDHQGYVHYVNTFDHRIWGASAGCMMDAHSIAARYAAKNAMRCWLGWAVVEDSVPRLVPYG